MDKIVCEISGGADSMLATLYAKEKYKDCEIYGIMINYGQITFWKELDKVVPFCKKENITLKVVAIRDLFSKGTVVGESGTVEDNVSDIYTPLRNLVILSCSSSYAESVGAKTVIVGSKSLNYSDDDPYSFKDSTLAFYKMFEAMLSYVAYKKITIEPILMNNRNEKMPKKQVYEELRRFGYTEKDYYNCFNNRDNYLDCNCNNCIERRSLA